MFGRMISVGARSNLNKSMVKLHNAQFGSPMHIFLQYGIPGNPISFAF